MAVILFGSIVRGESHDRSDIDICLVLRSVHWEVEKLAQKRFEYLHFDLDIKLFQQLPLYVRSRVLKEGRVLLVKDEDQLYEIAIRTAKEFEDFKHIYRDYLEAIARD
ncbi:MAG: nucleotidyltransferase domain-containing protein [Archaeoglobaceae archaeon]